MHRRAAAPYRQLSPTNPSLHTHVLPTHCPRPEQLSGHVFCAFSLHLGPPVPGAEARGLGGGGSSQVTARHAD